VSAILGAWWFILKLICFPLLRNSITIVLSTPFLIAALVGIVLSNILPYDVEDLVDDERAARAAQRAQDPEAFARSIDSSRKGL
jgi:xanthine/uracil permease